MLGDSLKGFFFFTAEFEGHMMRSRVNIGYENSLDITFGFMHHLIRSLRRLRYGLVLRAMPAVSL